MDFEDRVLYYDAFWHADGARVLLGGPPQFNLSQAFRRARFAALPSGNPLVPETRISNSSSITALAAPRGTTAVRLEFGAERLDIPVRPNLGTAFADRRIITAMNRDNDLGWIAEWAGFHARHHGGDAVALFDNGSTRYATGAIEATLAAVAGLKAVAVLAWPHKFGPVDPATLNSPFWPRFLQIASLSVTLRRFAPLAAGLLDCDIDELAAPTGGSIFAAAQRSRWGLVRLKGRWVPPVPATGAPAAGRTHRHYPYRDPRARKPSAGKWCLDPSRAWIAGNLGVHPYWHWIEGRPFAARFFDRQRFFWHFEAIHTGWKDKRVSPDGIDGGALQIDDLLASCWD
ncbi:MAG: hypothetical protein WEB63_03915 [Cucumibacter sp.]